MTSIPQSPCYVVDSNSSIRSAMPSDLYTHDTTFRVEFSDEAEGPRLLMFNDGSFETFSLPSTGLVVIGRGEQADIRIEHKTVSRRHAVLHTSADGFFLEDLGSSNGTRVEGRPLEPNRRTAVAAGKLFEIGSVALLIQSRPSEDTARPSASAPDPMEGLIERVARSTISVLLLGETGVGKEVFARRLHELSSRAKSPFVPLNCGALTEQLLQSELFGHEAGAFTGANHAKPGLLETADKGTVFLDEVGEMPMSAQVKLLRVLEDRRVLRVGGIAPRSIDVRFLAATNRDLAQEVTRGTFRRDLFYRLNGICLRIPPLRERQAEIVPLARQFATEAARKAGLDAVPTFEPDAFAALHAHSWPGNVRELRNVVERAVVLCETGTIRREHLFDSPPATFAPSDGERPVLDERSRILAALNQCAGNQTRAAKMLGVSRKTLGVKMDKFGIPRPQKSNA